MSRLMFGDYWEKPAWNAAIRDELGEGLKTVDERDSVCRIGGCLGGGGPRRESGLERSEVKRPELGGD